MAATGPLATTTLASPFGPIQVAVDARSVLALELQATEEAFRLGLRRRLGIVAEGPTAAHASAVGVMLRHATQAIEAYLDGDPGALDLPVTIVGRSEWDRRVLEGVRAIPFGAVTSYGRLATRIGAHGAARAVGGAVSRNPIGLFIPCHRIIAGDGGLGGYGGGPWGDRDASLDLKRALLDHEGVAIPAHRLLL